MAQYRQSGNFINGVILNGVASDHQQQQQQQPHVSIGIRSGASHKHHQQTRHHRHRRLKSGQRKISITVLIVFLVVGFFAAVVAFFYLSSQNKENIIYQTQDDEIGTDADFLTNVTRIQRSKVVKFGNGSVILGRDSRYWDRDDRRRDEDYSEEDSEQVQERSTDNDHVPVKGKISGKTSDNMESHKGLHQRNSGLYNEAGRDELKHYEAEYEASLSSILISKNQDTDQVTNDADVQNQNEMVDADDEYDDGVDSQDARMDGYSEMGNDDKHHSDIMKSQDMDDGESSAGTSRRNIEEADESSSDEFMKDSLPDTEHSDKVGTKPRHASLFNGQSGKTSSSGRRVGSRKKSKRRKYSGSCEMKILNSSALLVEPLESRKFARFSLQYTDIEEKPNEYEQWEPKFGGHQSLKEREESFLAQDQKVNCGFVKGPEGYRSTGLDLAEDDAKYISSCHIAVVSCIFGNSDRLRPPAGKTISKLSKKNVCFVMFVDQATLQTLSSEGHMLDRMGFIGLWRIVVVKNLPYTDMRRVGKIPKLLTHRLFPSARYSIWLDSKLRLQLDPLLILEYLLWRKGSEYAISNHYDRHCVWEEVAQNKKLNKYNHTVIDEQFAFYQADGLKRFDASDPNKMLPSNVPEGSLIVRAHTPMSNLFSCLWFNEVDRFTPRDQLSFAYTYYKLRKTNPEKPFHLNMFKDCERRKIAKLYHHRAEEKRSTPQHETE